MGVAAGFGRQDDRRVQLALADAGESHVRREAGGFGMVFDRRDHHRHHFRAVGISVGISGISGSAVGTHVHAMLHL